MKIATVTGYRYRLPLRAPLQLNGRTITVREGLLVRVVGASGEEGWGDVAPLPGFSPVSLAETHDELHMVARALCGCPLDEALAHVEKITAVSSVRFGMELALFDLHARIDGTTLPQALCETPRPAVSLNALLTGRGEAVLEAADRLRADGYRAVKLKVGRQSVPDDVALVRRVKERVGEAVALRLDANRAWSLDEARTFAGGVKGVSIAYIEEPLADAAALPAFVADTELPVALDETVQEGAAPSAHPYACAVIIKPTLAGGIVRAQQLVRQATENGMTPVLSAAFESGVGVRGLIALAAGFGPDDTPVGLGTYRWLAEDVLRPRLTLTGPCVDVAAVMDGDYAIDTDVRRDELLLTS